MTEQQRREKWNEMKSQDPTLANLLMRARKELDAEVKHIISLGAGVQSSTMALMAAHGEITPMPDAAIFADTQSEPASVYRHLDWLESKLPFPVYRVTAGSLRGEILAATRGEQRMDARPPFFVENGGMLNRQCTQDYKILPIQRKVRELIGLKPKQRGPKEVMVEQWIGISTDEASRMKPSRLPYVRHRWPLIEAGMTRGHCLAWMERNGYPKPPKSACTFCPYHDNSLWRDMKMNDPESFADAVLVDRAIRNGVKDRTNGRPVSPSRWYLHRSCVPLEEVDFSNAEDMGQGSLFADECEGMCGV
jgi:hypothetical protein